MELAKKLKAYYITAILSLVFAVIGFSYNAWRLEVTEDNSNIRTASFEVLKALAELEQLIYAAHYDKNEKEGNPRTGWVKIGLILDLSGLINGSVKKKAIALKETWTRYWEIMAQDRDATNRIVETIEAVREEIKRILIALE